MGSFSGIISYEIVLQDTTLRPLDCWIWPRTRHSQLRLEFSAIQGFHMFCIVLWWIFRKRFVNGVSILQKLIWLLEFGSQLSHSVFCTCKLNSSMNFMRIVSTVIVVKIVTAVRSHVGLETSLDMTYEEGPSAVCFLSVRSEIVNFKVKLKRIKLIKPWTEKMWVKQYDPKFIINFSYDQFHHISKDEPRGGLCVEDLHGGFSWALRSQWRRSPGAEQTSEATARVARSSI